MHVKLIQIYYQKTLTYDNSMNREKQIVKVSIVWIITNLALVVFKAIIWFISNSIAIVLDALNNLSDVLSSTVTIVWIKLSSKKPDKEHPYWHGRIEYFSAIIIAMLILIAWLVALKESVLKIIHGEKAEYSAYMLIIIIAAIITKIFLWKYVKRKWQKLNSWSLIASGIDAINDAFISLSTLIAAIISMIWWFSLEGYLWAIISLFIIKTAFSLLKESVNDVIWVRADQKMIDDLKSKISSYEWVLWVYDLILHNYGPNNIIAMAHIQVNDEMKAKKIHRLTRTISTDIFTEYGIILTLGIYACNDEWIYGDIQKKLNGIIKKHKSVIQMHGFYVDEKVNTVYFDLIFNFEEKKPENIVKTIKHEIKKDFPQYEYNIIIDTDFSD